MLRRSNTGRLTREGGYPVRRGLPILSDAPEYWIARWSLSSGGAARPTRWRAMTAVVVLAAPVVPFDVPKPAYSGYWMPAFVGTTQD